MKELPENLPPPPEGFEVYGYGPVPKSVRKLTEHAMDLSGWTTLLPVLPHWKPGRVGLYDDWVYAARKGSPTHAILFADRATTPATQHEF